MSAFLDEMGTLITVSSSNPLPVGGKSVQKSASFTRPADTTAYAANDEFRIRKEAVYTANFTPPTAPFTY